MTRGRAVLTGLVGTTVVIVGIAAISWNATHAEVKGGAPFALASQAVPYTYSESIILLVVPGKDSVEAFSRYTGSWQKQSIPPIPGETITPILGKDVACFQAGNRLFAFSGP